MKKITKTHRASQTTLRLQNIVFTLLLMVVIGLLAWLGKTYHKDFDMSLKQQNSLHASTQKLLMRLDKPLKLTAYVPDDATVHAGLKKIVAKYKKHKIDTVLEFVNPELNPKRAKDDGIEYSGQLKISLGDRSETVNSADEQTFVNVLQRISRNKPRLALFIEGHGERSIFSEKSSGLSQFTGALEKQGFTFQPHNLIRTQNIPAGVSFIVIATPQKEYLEDEVKIIQDYLKSGGNLLWLHDPGSVNGLDALEQQLGLIVHEGTIVDANQALQKMLGIKHPAVIAVIDYGESEMTKDLSAHVLFPFPTAIQREEGDDEVKDSQWQYQPILTTLPTSWLESGEIEGNVKFDDDADKPGPLDIGMLLTKSSDEESSDSKTTMPEQRVLVLGDGDFLANNFIGQGSNLELAKNIFNWLGSDDELLSIKAVKAPDTELNMPGWALFASGLFFLILLPAGLILIGTVRWLKRRKR
ncbi:MAG: Gldg family protein [Cocleimonas sp.]